MAAVSPVAAITRVYPEPDLVMVRPLNVATPPTAATVVVPLNVAPPGLLPRETVTLFVKHVCNVPAASCAWTVTESVVPAPTLAGCAVITSCVGVQPAVGSEWHVTTSNDAATREPTRARRVRRNADM